jgi:hypothetical protein
MPFSITQYETAVSKVAKGAGELRDLIPQIKTAASITLSHQWYLPIFVRNAVRWFADQLATLLEGILDIIVDQLQSAVVPLRFIVDTFAWQNVRGQASMVAGTLKSTPLSVDGQWSGPAHDAYVAVIRPQSDAADRIAKIAGRTAQALGTCAAAGFAFYIGLGFILYKLIPATITAVAAIGTEVFSSVGVGLVLEEAAIGAGLLSLFLTTLAGLVAAQGNEMMAVHGESVDMTMFPRGHWPDPVTHNYHDGTVTDGDADWSLRRQ